MLSWIVEPHAVPGWIREPNIGFSQVGYRPAQPKVAVIELDKNDRAQASSAVYKIGDDGKPEKVFEGKNIPWGNYFKYHYIKFDFSKITRPGIYYIQYGKYKTNNFLVQDNVYEKITDATSDIWIPIHITIVT